MDDAPKRDRDDEVAWGIASHGEPRWQALSAVLVAIGLQLVLPQRSIRGLGTRSLIPALEGALLIVLLIANPGQISRRHVRLRVLAVSLIALISAANVIRQRPDHRHRTSSFPQMTMSGSAPGWTPSFLDYLYTAFTNATAIGPTDAMPLTAWAKSLMALQSLRHC